MLSAKNDCHDFKVWGEEETHSIQQLECKAFIERVL
jgi:hypothetical protein